MSEFKYDKVAVGIRIKDLRLANGLTQENVAEKLDKSNRFVQDIERGMVGMSISTMLDLCRILRTTPNDLLLPGDKPDTSELEWLINALTNSSDHVRKTAIEIVKAYLRNAN